MISEYHNHQSDLNESHGRQRVIEKIIYFTLGFIRAFNITCHVFNMVKISLFGIKHPFFITLHHNTSKDLKKHQYIIDFIINACMVFIFTDSFNLFFDFR